MRPRLNNSGLLKLKVVEHHRIHTICITVILIFSLVTPRFFAYADNVAQGNPLAQASWFAVYIYAALLALRNRFEVQKLVSAFPSIWLLIALAAFSILWSVDGELTAKRIFGLFFCTLLAYGITSEVSQRELIRIIEDVAIVVAITCIGLAIVAPGFAIMQTVYAGAWQGTFVDKNALGLTMCFVIISVALSSFKRSIAQKWKSRFVITMCMFMLYKAQSLTSVGITVAIITMTVIARVIRNGNTLTKLYLFASALVFGLVVCLFVYDNGAAASLEMLGRDSSFSGRTDIWGYVQNAIAERPLFGYGYDVFWRPDGISDEFIPYSVGWHPYHSHEGYLELMLDCGLAGLALFIACVIQALSRIARLLKTDRSLVWPATTIIFFVLLNLSESRIIKYNEFDWIIFLVAILSTHRMHADAHS